MAYSESGYESDFQSSESSSNSSSDSVSTAPSWSDDAPVRVSESADPSPRSDDRGRTTSWNDDSTSQSIHPHHDPYANAQPAGAGPLSSLRRFFRRMFGLPDDDAPDGMAAGQLAALAREGLDLHPHYGNQSVAHVAERMGFPELAGKMAYEQVAYMGENWSTLDAAAAQQRANAGGLVVAGSGGPSQAHTAIVTPGSGATAADGAFYPNVSGGGVGGTRSDGTRTVAEVWPAGERAAVRYFTPR